jgi:sulfite exporter TauE/SafE
VPAILRPPYLAALLLGSLQGALPCALVYGAASRAVVAGSAASGALTMLVFGLGTVPAVVGLTLLPRAVLVRVRT